jgi:Uma2 family endonuclease
MAVQLTRRRFTRDEYHWMARVGILGEDDRVELIEGEILQMSPIGRRHVSSLDRLNHIFVRALGDVAIVRVGGSIVLSEHNEPQPDLVLLRPRADYYATADATPADVFLIVEVSDTSIQYDRQVKAPLYARRGIPELWIVDVAHDHIIGHRDPTDNGYATTRVFRRGETIRPAAFPDLQIAVDEIIG